MKNVLLRVWLPHKAEWRDIVFGLGCVMLFLATAIAVAAIYPPRASIIASRFAVWTSLQLVAMVMAMVAYKSQPLSWQDPFTRILVGAGVEAQAWAIHQAYWWGSELADFYGRSKVWFHDNATAIQLAYIGSLLGAILMLSPITERVLGRAWFLISCLFVMLVWLVGLQFAVGS